MRSEINLEEDMIVLTALNVDLVDNIKIPLLPLLLLSMHLYNTLSHCVSLLFVESLLKQSMLLNFIEGNMNLS